MMPFAPDALIASHYQTLLLAIGILTPNLAPSQITTYTNPLEVKIADPAVLRTDKGAFRYYLAGTSAVRHASDDLVNWRRLADWTAFEGTWARPDIWAAEAVEHRGAFYYHFGAKGASSAGRRLICIARADSPDDTFAPHAYPLWDDGFTWIDSHIFVDGDGAAYLFATNDSKGAFGGKARIAVARLAEDFTAIAEEPRFLMEPSQAWEHAWQEGAAVLRRGGTYYLTWSSQLYASDRYSVGYATANNIYGPWTKAPENPILRQMIERPEHIGHAGPGHNSFVLSPDGTELFVVYHTRRNSPESGERQLNIDRAIFAERDGAPAQLIFPGAPTNTPQPMPAGAAPSPTACSDEFDGDAVDHSIWTAIWGHVPRRLRVRDGALEIDCMPGQVWREKTGGENIVLQHAPAGPWTATTRVDFDPRADYEQAFLVVWQDSNNYLMLKHVHAGGPRFEASIEIHEDYRSVLVPNEIGTRPWLRVRHDGASRYWQEVSADGEAWQPVGEAFDARLHDVRVGLGAWSPNSPRRNATARFEFFRFEAGAAKE